MGKAASADRKYYIFFLNQVYTNELNTPSIAKSQTATRPDAAASATSSLESLRFSMWAACLTVSLSAAKNVQVIGVHFSRLGHVLMWQLGFTFGPQMCGWRKTSTSPSIFRLAHEVLPHCQHAFVPRVLTFSVFKTIDA
jgi:hypothetical protein